MQPDAPDDDGPVAAQGRERLLLTALHKLEVRIKDLSDQLEGLSSTVSRLQAEQRSDAKRIREHEVRIARLRLDRQILGLPRWLAARVARNDHSGRRDSKLQISSTRRSQPQLLVVAPKYPATTWPYGGQPIERRIRFYRAAGYDVMVFVPSVRNSEDERMGVRVVRANLAALPEVVESMHGPQICVHHPLPDIWHAVKPMVGVHPVHAWIHGYEARNWRDLGFTLGANELRDRGAWLDAVNVERQIALQELFADVRVRKIFISQFIQRVAEKFVGQVAINAEVIHNVIDTELFSYREKTADQRLRILAVRSFAGRSYGTDLLGRVIRRLSSEPWFCNLHFEIRGDGKHWEEDTEGIASFENVSLERRIVDPEELVQLHAENGVMLIPTRWDSQGMTIGEGMASGLVPVTNSVTGIPEFVDDESGVLAGPEDVEGLAAGIRLLYDEPSRFLALSKAAAERVQWQCGPEVTVARELELLENARK